MLLIKRKGLIFVPSILCDGFLLLILLSSLNLINVTFSSVPIILTTVPSPLIQSTIINSDTIISSANTTVSSLLFTSNDTTTNVSESVENITKHIYVNNHQNKEQQHNKEMPIQYTELETLKTLSKRFDIYSDFSKIPFDTVHRILRDEESEAYRYFDDQRFYYRRWKKSTSTKAHQKKQHKINKRSTSALSSSDLNTSNNSEQFKTTLLSDNYHKIQSNYEINSNIKNNNNNFIYNNDNSSIRNSSNNDSTKLLLINLNNRDGNFSDNDIINILSSEMKLNLSKIERLNLIDSHLNEFSLYKIEKLVNLKYLDLTNNKLKTFVLNKSSKIQVLNLSGNQVSNFTIISSMPFASLEPLNLSSSPSTKVATTIVPTIASSSSLFSLTELNLSRNNLTSLKFINISELNELETLDLSCNQLQYIDKNYFFGQTKSLKRLNLSGNKLNTLSKENEPFYNLLSIDTLILFNNNISTIDLETFLNLPNLQYLDLSYNNIQGNSIRALQGIPDLVGLSIAHNTELGDSLQEFVASWSLKELDLSGTGLCQIPAALAQSVRSLKLVNNWFEIIRCGDLDSYPLLQYLDISYCHISDIEDDALGRLEILETLFLDHNNLNHIPISLPISLENLFLQHNQIMDIQPQQFQQLINLKILDLSNNKIMYLPGLPLPNLLTLNMQSCELKGLSQSVVKSSPKLRDLLLDGNPIKCTELMGIAEWASPCQQQQQQLNQSDRSTSSSPIEAIKNDIKSHFQNMRNYFDDFKGFTATINKCKINENNNRNNNNYNEVLKTDSCCGNWKKDNLLKKPICANKNKMQKKKIQEFISDGGSLEMQNFQVIRKPGKGSSKHQSNKSLKTLKRNENEGKRKLYKSNNNHYEQNINNTINSEQKILISPTQLHRTSSFLSSFFPNPSPSSSLILNDNFVVSNNEQQEVIVKNLEEKLFSNTNKNQSKNNEDNDNNNNILIVDNDAKNPILSFASNSSKNIIQQKTKTTTMKNIEQEQQKYQIEEVYNINSPKSIKSDNNYVKTNVLFESIKNQKWKQRQQQNGSSHQTTKNKNGQKSWNDNNNDSSKRGNEKELQQIIEGKEILSKKYIEMMPNKKKNITNISSLYFNENSQEKPKATTRATIVQNDNDEPYHKKDNLDSTNTNSRNYSGQRSIINDGNIDMSNTIKSNQGNENKFLKIESLTAIKNMAAISSKTISSATLSYEPSHQEIFFNDQSFISSPSSGSSSVEDSVDDVTTTLSIPNITKDKYKINPLKEKSNLQESNKLHIDNINPLNSNNSYKLFSNLTLFASMLPTTTKTTKMMKFSPELHKTADKVKFSDQSEDKSSTTTNSKQNNDIISYQNQNISNSLGQDYHHHNHQWQQKQQQIKLSLLSSDKHEIEQITNLHHQPAAKLSWSSSSGKQHENLMTTTTTTAIITDSQQQKPEIANITRKSNLNESQNQQENRKIMATQTTTTTTTNTINADVQGSSDKRDNNKQDNINAINILSNKIIEQNETIKNDRTPSFSSQPQSKKNVSMKFSKIAKLNPIAILTNTTTKLPKRIRKKDTNIKRHNDTKNQKVLNSMQNIPLSNMKSNNQDFLIKSNLKNSKKNEFLTETITTVTPSKILQHEQQHQKHNHLNTPKDKLTSSDNLEKENIRNFEENMKTHIDSNVNDINGNSSMENDLILDKNSKNDENKFTTHSMAHHSVNTAIVPFTRNDYIFGKSTRISLQKGLPSSISGIPLQMDDSIGGSDELHYQSTSDNLDILLSYSNDEPSISHEQQISSSNLNSNTSTTSKIVSEQSHIIFNNKKPVEFQQNYFRNKENNSIADHLNNQQMHENLQENAHNNSSNSSNSVGDGMSKITNNTETTSGLPPEQLLDIRKATGHPGLFIVIGVTFGMIVTVGLIHIYRCRRPWYYYYNQKRPHHPLELHQQHYHHHHHQRQQLHQLQDFPLQDHYHHQQYNHYHRFPNNKNYYQYRSAQCNAISSEDNCHDCNIQNENEYYIEADYESQASPQGEFLPMELLSLHNNSNHTDESFSNSNSNLNYHRVSSLQSSSRNDYTKTSNMNGPNLDIW